MAKSKSAATLQEHAEALSRACRELPPVTVISGEDEFLRRRATERIVAALKKKHPGLDEVCFHGAPSQNEPGASLAQTLPELASSSLFAAEKLVLLRQADRMLFPRKGAEETEAEPAPAAKSGRGDTAAEALVAYLAAPAQGTWLLIECAKLNRQYSLGKALAGCPEVPCPAPRSQGEVAAWLGREAKELGKRLDHGVADLLITAHGTGLGALRSELEKLAVYTGDDGEIALEDAKAFLSGSVEFDVFGLTNAVQARDMTEALKFARRINTHGLRSQDGKKTDAGGSAHMALSLLAGTVEGMLAARALPPEEGDPKAALAAKLRIHPFRAELLLKAVRNYSIPDLRAAALRLAEETRRTHDTGADSALSLELAALACCRGAK